MGNPDLPTPAARHRQAERDGRQAAHRPLFRLARHSRPAPRAGRLLRAPLRREAQSRHAGRRHARLEGRLRQRGAGDHRAGRRRPRAQPELSDPCLRLPDGGRRDPLGAGRARRRTSSRALERAIAPLDPEADRGRGLLSVEPDGLRRRASISIATSSPSRRSTTSSSCPISPMPRSISTTIRRRRCCRCRARSTSTVEFTSMSKTYSMAGWRMGFAVGNERLIAALARVKSYLDYGAFTPIQVAAAAALNGPDDCIARDARDLQEAPRRAGRELRPRRLGRSGAARLDVRLGADPGAVPRPRQRSSSPSCWSRRPRSRCRPASASASTAKASCASRWSRTSSASARPRATSAASSRPAPKQLHNVVPLATRR